MFFQLYPQVLLACKLGSACEEFEDIEGGMFGLMFLRVLVWLTWLVLHKGLSLFSCV